MLLKVVLVESGMMAWRIRLVAYGASLESWLSASSRGFESPILRQSLKPRKITSSGVFCIPVLLFQRAPEDRHDHSFPPHVRDARGCAPRLVRMLDPDALARVLRDRDLTVDDLRTMLELFVDNTNLSSVYGLTIFAVPGQDDVVDHLNE